MMPVLDVLILMRDDKERRLKTCMQMLKDPNVGDTAKSYFYGESLYLQSTLDWMEYAISMYHGEHTKT